MFFRYLAARLRHRQPGAAPFLRQGLGIENRARRLHEFWQPHFDRTKAAQRRWVESGTGGIDLAVLGAGRLFDLDTAALAPNFRRFLLIDADPSCTPYWRDLGAEIEACVGDLTGCLDRWQGALDAIRGDWEESLAQVRAIPSPSDHAMTVSADAVLSLNVLGQLPIGWQDRVENHLRRRFGARHTRAHKTEWLAAVEPGAKWIVEGHLAAMAGPRTHHILLITDIEYADYHRADGSRELTPALYGVDPHEVFKANYDPQWSDTWTWDISPAGTESPCCGSAHRVAAFAFERRR